MTCPNFKLNAVSKQMILIIFHLFIFSPISSLNGQTNNIYFEPYPIRSFQTNGGVPGIATADFNGDGKVDVAVTEMDESTLSILLNETIEETILLSDPIAFSVGWSPWSIVTGDFDNDGKPDIITVNYDSEDITILRNISTEIATNFEISTGCQLKRLPKYMCSGDFDRDNKLDLAVANMWSDTISILKNVSNEGNIVFQIDLEIPIEFFGESIVATDFDNDGKIDIATLSLSGVSVLRNTGVDNIISFAEPSDFNCKKAISRITAADFNNDGMIDIAASEGSEVVFLRNNSAPNILDFILERNTHPIGGGYVASIYPCDLNNDSKIDLLFANPFIFFSDPRIHNHISVLTNKSTNGEIEFNPYILYAVAEDPWAITSADFDDNGKIDMAVGCIQSKSISILQNISTSDEIKLNSAASFLPESLAGPIQGGDFDKDGRKDLVITNVGNNTIEILRNNSRVGELEFLSDATYPTGLYPDEIELADFNNDGKLDIAVVNEDLLRTDRINYGTISIFKNESDIGRIVFRSDSVSIGGIPYTMATGDFDSDGKIDIIVGRNYNDLFTSRDSLLILQNISTEDEIIFEITARIEIFGGAPKSIALSDFDGDGRIDLTVGNPGLAEVLIFKNESYSGNILFTLQSNLTYFSFLTSVDACDLDGDNKDDLVVTQAGSEGNLSGCSILRNTSEIGNISFDIPVDYEPIRDPRSCAVTDMNEDGKSDIVLGNQNGQFVILENKSSVGFIQFSPAFPGFIILGDHNYYISDLDGDSHNEIAGSRSDMKEIYILRTSTEHFSIVKNDNSSIASACQLYQNYPNPFNPTTTIDFNIPKKSHVKISVYDILGRRIVTLIDNEFECGLYHIKWDGCDSFSKKVPSGLYFCKMETNEFSLVKKSLLVK